MNKFFFGMMALAAMAGGCESGSNKQASNRTPLRPAVIDISPTPPANIAPVQPIQPVATAQPVEPAAPASFNAAPAAPAAGGSYTVKKGDTLYKIAREHYGDGKQWQKIASANPGLSPSTLKVGQKITMP